MVRQVKMVQLTNWADEVEKVETTKYGSICMKIWLEKEKGRIEKTKGRRAEIRMHGKNEQKIALFVNQG